tara:strand:+ start:1003 stop:1653 length:651 start_codon:yes stop_codon:yes gene_type:complete
MKISKNRLREIIKEELQRVIREEEDDSPLRPDQGTTKIVPRAQLNPQKAKTGIDPNKTQVVDVATAIKREQESLEGATAAITFREEAERLFRKFFAGIDEDALEIMIHNDEELGEIVAKLYGWNLDLFPHDRQPSPTIVKVAQDFEKERRDIVDNEDEFLSRVEQELYKTGLDKFKQGQSKPPAAATRVKKGQAAIPGTKQHSQLQDLFKSFDPKS